MEQSLNLLDEALVLVSSSPPGRVILIEDQVETSGAFVLHHLIKRTFSLDNSSVVIFIALSHPFSHYERILRKLGCNVVAQRENNRFIFFDMLNLQCPDGNEGGLIDLYRKLEKAVTVSASASPEQKRSITIMIDDISLLEVAANGSSNYVLDFLHYCHTLTSENGCSLVILNHNDIYSNMIGPSLTLQMEYFADIVIKTEPLSTGLAADVHGQLTVLNKGTVDGSGSVRSKLHNFHFKVKENSVEYFYPGSRT